MLGASLGADANAKVISRIVNGTAVDINEVPWQGSLHVIAMNNNPTIAVLQQICGTVLIGYKWAMTAAHCTYDQKADALLVRFGSAMLYRGGLINEVSRIIQHEQFNPYSMDYDFSLLELVNIVPFSARIRPAMLPKSGEEFQPGTEAFVSGWGETRNITQSQFNLRAVKVPIYNHTKCEQDYVGTNDVTSRMICAGFEQGGRDGESTLIFVVVVL